jgi:hypothetical protein
MKNWKFDLFTVKQSLTLDQLEIASVLENHIQNFDRMSEKELTESLKYTLQPFAYDNDVKKLFEAMEEELQERPLLYELKDLYKKVERKNYGSLYRDPLNKVLDIISKDDDSARMDSILNELIIYDWVPEIKAFLIRNTGDPIQKKNLTSDGAKLSKVYSIVEQAEDGHIAFVGDRWFHLSKDEIKQCVLHESVKDEKKLRVLKVLEKAMQISSFENEILNFRVDEHLTLGVGINGKIYINGEKTDKETSLEDLFNSPLIPYLKKNLYEVVKTTVDNLDKIIELDVASKVTSLSKPTCETYAFNYKDKMYLYTMDKRTGSSFFEYDSVNQLIQDVQREMNYDVSDVFENKLSKEMKQYKKLEDREKEIEMKIKEVNESIDELNSNAQLMETSPELKAAFDNLLIHKHNLVKNLNDIKNDKVKERKQK